MIGIYKITSPSGKIYIGQSTNIENRFSTYKYLNCKSQRKLYNSLKKYGCDNHEFEVLEECSIEYLNYKERYYQDLFSVINHNGLNCMLTKTNDKSGYLSIETKAKMSKPKSEETRLKMSKPKSHETKLKMKEAKSNISEETKLKLSEAKKGVSRSEDTKDNISKSCKGKKRSKEARLNMSEVKKKIILNTNTGVFYFGIKEAADSIGMKFYNLRGRLNGIVTNNTDLIYI